MKTSSYPVCVYVLMFSTVISLVWLDNKGSLYRMNLRDVILDPLITTSSWPVKWPRDGLIQCSSAASGAVAVIRAGKKWIIPPVQLLVCVK